MNITNLDYDDLHKFATDNVVDPFFINRIKKLKGLTLIGRKDSLLRRKNPYLFRTKNIQTSGDFVKYALDAFLSSSEETMFGNLLENLAIHICSQIFDGYKAPTKVMKSVDLVFSRDGVRYIVGIKSGPDWGNQDQKDRMASNFKTVREYLRQNGETMEIIGVNGCMYGVDENPWKQNNEDSELSYYKYCGQRFWEFISGDKDLYLRIIQPLGEEARKRSEEYDNLYNGKINELTSMFSANFIGDDNQIDWVKLIRYVSSSKIE